MADVLTAELPAPSTGQASDQAAREAGRYSHTGEMIKAKMPGLVKGAGYINGNSPLQDEIQIMTKAHQATLDLRIQTGRGYSDRASVVKGLNPDFLSNYGYLKTALSAPSLSEQLAQAFNQLPGGEGAFKSFTAGNLGIGSVI